MTVQEDEGGATSAVVASPVPRNTSTAGGQPRRLSIVVPVWKQEGDELAVNVPMVAMERQGTSADQDTLQERISKAADAPCSTVVGKRRREHADHEEFKLESSLGSLPEDDLWEELEPVLSPATLRHNGKANRATSGRKTSAQAGGGIAAAVSAAPMASMPGGGPPSEKIVQTSVHEAQEISSASKTSPTVARASAAAATAGATETHTAMPDSEALTALNDSCKDSDGHKPNHMPQFADNSDAAVTCAVAMARIEQPSQQAGSIEQHAGLDASAMELDVMPQDKPPVGSQQQMISALQDKDSAWSSFAITHAMPALAVQQDSNVAGRPSGKPSAKVAGKASGKMSGKMSGRRSGMATGQARGKISSRMASKASGRASGKALHETASNAFAEANKEARTDVPGRTCADNASVSGCEWFNKMLVQATAQGQPLAEAIAAPAAPPIADHDEACKQQHAVPKPAQSAIPNTATHSNSIPMAARLMAFTVRYKSRAAAAAAAAATKSTDNNNEQDPDAVRKARASGSGAMSGGGAASDGRASGPGLAGGMFACPQTTKFRALGLRRAAGKRMLVRKD